ncbi:hypothetical protein D1AOALGA4SA_12349 [Olavius algarvensis Delta 1 endosymbiont]|nr:hypothetical protein D1AOALGA4SA_12349 [Olavius algarvensis Delta 1 endosymbiont]
MGKVVARRWLHPRHCSNFMTLCSMVKLKALYWEALAMSRLNAK